MLEKQTIANLRLVHGLFNLCVFVFCLYQARLGWKIRKGRQASAPDIAYIKKHRRFGPFLALFGISGFFAGVVLILIDKGRVMEYPLHFICGLSIASGLTAMFLISRKITAADTTWRNIHFRLGLALVCLYVFQVFLGLGILF